MNLIAPCVLKVSMAFLSASFSLGVLGVYISLPPSLTFFLSLSCQRREGCFKILTLSSQEHVGIGVKPKCICPLSFYTSFLKHPLWKTPLPASRDWLGLDSPMSTLGLSLGGWEQWKSSCLLVQG